MITFNKFKETVLDKMTERYKGKYKVCLIDVPKNTGGTEVGLNITKENIEDGIVFRLEDYYKYYDTDISMEEVIVDISNIIDENSEGMEESGEIREDFNTAKGRIVYRLINKKLNNEWLKGVPYRDFFDMAVVYYILLNKSEHGQMSIDITNEYMEKWGVDEEELYNIAKENTPKLYPCRVESVRDIVRKIHENSKRKDEEWQQVERYLKEDEDYPLYELDQEDSINGATALIYQGVLKMMADMLESDLIIFPVTICEVLIAPYKEDMGASDYKRLMKHLSDTVLPFEEVLSKGVFRYSREDDYLDYTWPDGLS